MRAEKHHHEYATINRLAKTARCWCGKATRLSRIRGYRKPAFR